MDVRKCIRSPYSVTLVIIIFNLTVDNGKLFRYVDMFCYMYTFIKRIKPKIMNVLFPLEKEPMVMFGSSAGP